MLVDAINSRENDLSTLKNASTKLNNLPVLIGKLQGGEGRIKLGINSS